MSDTTLQQAQALLRELVEAAKKGAIIPVRLAGQLEAIDALLEAAATAPQAAPPTAAVPADQTDLLKAQAYFVSHAVHELRTPMTSIRGYSDMLVSPSMGTLTDMQRQFLETIRTNARRMDGLMMDVSDMAKLRGGALRVNQTMELFKNVVGYVEKAMQPVAEQLGRALVFDVPSGLPLLNTDGELLAKAINKLVENGLRYNERADGKVTVRGRADGNTLVIEVEDDGIGIAPEDFARLGEVYFRSDDERVRAHKGSGLGIPVAYGIIALLGGTYTVQTTVGAGTTFTIRLAGMS
jgi:signal transduction histidine kinase